MLCFDTLQRSEEKENWVKYAENENKQTNLNPLKHSRFPKYFSFLCLLGSIHQTQ